MTYAKVVNGALIEAPKNYKLEDGRLILNFNLDADLMKAHGFKPIKRNKPTFNEETQTLVVLDFEDNEDVIVINYGVSSKGKTLSNRVSSLEDNSVNLIATTWDMDYRVCELEWALEDSGILVATQAINLRTGGERTVALSRYEQAKIMILGGAYVRETLERQLGNYLKRGYLIEEEYDELIALMDARELVTEEEK